MFPLVRRHRRLGVVVFAVALVALATGLALWGMSRGNSGGEAWHRVEWPPGNGEKAIVTMDVPIGWQVTEGTGFDSRVGSLEGPGMLVNLELGNNIVGPGWFDHDSDTRTETIGNGEVWIHMPAPLSEGVDTVSGAFFRKIPGSGYPADALVFSLWAKGLAHYDQQETLLRIIRSVKYAG